ncbi:MAG: DUF1957 domain-containing protein [Proteobacteria bacterium]|nr:DUF1957 domain-containing protein [Pseudomonadota bacterium]MCP4915557.1 DUF1957 domain-containing protein [Pseudomonadota bacterium]
MAAGSFVIVLHGHLPWVLEHGRWPHGEEWLFEAAAETWLPLLATVRDIRQAGAAPTMAIGLTPILLEQLSSPAFQDRFARWLRGRQKRALADAAEFGGDVTLVALATRWAEHFVDLAVQFDAIDRDIPGAFAALWQQGAIEIMGSAATHAFLPLLRTDAACRAQVRIGLETSERILGRRPTGFWLPECAYRPGGPWKPPVLDRGLVDRQGLEGILAGEGVAWTVLDEHLLAGARTRAVLGENGPIPVGWDQAGHEPERAWRSPLEVHRVGEVSVLARHRQLSEQVWSARIGYPGDGRYLEFHKKHGQDGLRYWRVTSARADLGRKERYEPEAVAGAVYSHAQHFATMVRSMLQTHQDAHGRKGVLVAPFDAELFGHWWHEGPAWLRDVLLTLGADAEVDLATPSDVLASADKQVEIPAGSWGDGGDDRVWLEDKTRWIWEVLHRAEHRMGVVVRDLNWRGSSTVRKVLVQAARELLLMQASDWPFVVTTKGAPDYGFKRVSGHASRFDRLCDLAQDLDRGGEPTETQKAQLREAELADSAFADVDLALFG